MQNVDNEGVLNIEQADYRSGFQDGWRAHLPLKSTKAYVKGYNDGFSIDFGDPRMKGSTVGEILTRRDLCY